MKIRILPILIFFLMLNLAFKVSSVLNKDIISKESFSDITLTIKEAEAQETKHGEEKAQSPEEIEQAKIKAEREEKIKNASSTIPGASIKEPEHIEKSEYSPVELEILKNLSSRRAKLDLWEQEIERQANLLKATEKKLDKKLSDLKFLEKEVKDLLVFYEAKEDAKTERLVAIYENMKPKDAAQIFEVLDMNVLLPVFFRMKEGKIASILSNMTPKRSTEITVQFTEFKKLKRPQN